MNQRIVHKIEPDMNPRDVECTTYQMRNCFRQFYDGVASELDVMCYFMHAAAADLCPKGGRVLDVCCGRGLLIPFLRYGGKAPSLYVGVDIHPANAVWREGKDPRRPSEQKTDWGFDLVFVESNVATMCEPVVQAVGDQPFDLIVYTSSIEHMQPEAQRQGLIECGNLASAGTVLYLSCPVTEAGRSGYSTQYAAHVYEPTEVELLGWLKEAGWRVKRRIGLSTKTGTFRKRLKGNALNSANYLYDLMPREMALPVIAALHPQAADEVAYICGRVQ